MQHATVSERLIQDLRNYARRNSAEKRFDTMVRQGTIDSQGRVLIGENKSGR